MGTVFVISPDYLENVFKEAKKYEFKLQGYGNCEDACKGLIYVNVSEILGFAYIADALPLSNTREYASLLKFLNLCNLMNSNKKFIFISISSVNNYERVTKKFSTLRFYYKANVDCITDVTINKGIFGSILLDNYQPYEFEDLKTEQIQLVNPENLKYNTLFPKVVYDCLKHVKLLTDVDSTLDTDIILKHLNDVNLETLALFREYIILLRYHAETVEIELKIENHLASMENEKEFALYFAIFRLLQIGGVSICI